jgi:hypothetical protein
MRVDRHADILPVLENLPELRHQVP